MAQIDVRYMLVFREIEEGMCEFLDVMDEAAITTCGTTVEAYTSVVFRTTLYAVSGNTYHISSPHTPEEVREFRLRWPHSYMDAIPILPAETARHAMAEDELTKGEST